MTDEELLAALKEETRVGVSYHPGARPSWNSTIVGLAFVINREVLVTLETGSVLTAGHIHKEIIEASV